jgi:GT2 family glycosyltransferase
LFLNPDTEILQGTFADLIAELERRPEVGLVGVRSRTHDHIEWPTIRRFPTPLRMLCESLGAEHLPVHASWMGQRELDPGSYERDTECDWVSGSFMLARREALLGAGLMDERFFLYCEEPDLCLRMKNAGWQVRHLPTMQILHHARRRGYNQQMIAQEAYAHRQYMQKHFGPVRRRTGVLAYALGHAVRALFGGRDRQFAREQRRVSRAALRAVLGLSPPPFTEAPPTSVAPVETPEHVTMRAAV